MLSEQDVRTGFSVEATAVVSNYLLKLEQVLETIPVERIVKLGEIMLKAYHAEANIFIMGNGGSAATASHIVADINKGVSYGLDKRFKMTCLNDNIPSIMAYANDVAYEDIFVEQLKNFVKLDDLVIGISGSGNSPNILNAIRFANDVGAYTVGLTGFDGGKLAGMVRHSIIVPVFDMQKTEDVHMTIGHVLMQVLHGWLHGLNGD